MINLETGGSKTIVNNTVVYNFQSEKSKSAYKLLTLDEETI